MQGVFAGHAGIANWGELLDPNFDDETQRELREREAQNRAALRAQAARGGGAVAPAPAPVQYPSAPSPRFTVKGMPFFILKGSAVDTPPRPGVWGHYLVPYMTSADGLTATPFKETGPDNAASVDAESGFPGKPLSGADSQPKPDGLKCAQGREFVRATDPATYWEVGMNQVRRILEDAEARDLAFARRMEGFGIAARSAAWDCLDPDYDPSDRDVVMNQFMAKYLERFYTRQNTGNTPGAAKVAEEALQKHKAFCKAWVQKHYKTLTPVITSPAEALASDFHATICSALTPAPDRLPTTMELARVFMRDEGVASEFAQALHFYSGALEQGRGARNASYKQMRQTEAARIASYKRFGGFLETNWRTLGDAIREGGSLPGRYLHALTVDWYDILGQMPPIHRHFEEVSSFQGMSERQSDVDGGVLPPWLFSRDV
jgi:hypothetical protein